MDAALSGGAGIGALAALGTALGYAFSAILLKTKFTGYDGRGVVGITTVLSAFLLLPAALLTLPDAVPSAGAVGSLAVLGLASTAGGFVLFFRLAAGLGPGRASIVAYIAPGIAVLLGVVFRDDPFGISTVVGLALILLGRGSLPDRGSSANRSCRSRLANRKRRRPPRCRRPRRRRACSTSRP